MIWRLHECLPVVEYPVILMCVFSFRRYSTLVMKQALHPAKRARWPVPLCQWMAGQLRARAFNDVIQMLERMNMVWGISSRFNSKCVDIENVEIHPLLISGTVSRHPSLPPSPSWLFRCCPLPCWPSTSISCLFAAGITGGPIRTDHSTVLLPSQPAHLRIQ